MMGTESFFLRCIGKTCHCFSDGFVQELQALIVRLKSKPLLSLDSVGSYKRTSKELRQNVRQVVLDSYYGRHEY